MGTARVTFIINEQGVIEEIIEKVDTKNHTDQILKGIGTSPTKPAVKKTPAKKAPTKKTGNTVKKPAKKSAKKNVKKGRR